MPKQKIRGKSIKPLSRQQTLKEWKDETNDRLRWKIYRVVNKTSFYFLIAYFWLTIFIHILIIILIFYYFGNSIKAGIDYFNQNSLGILDSLFRK